MVRQVVGVDVGGTFTDLVVAGPGPLRVHKRASTPDDPTRAVLELLAEADRAEACDVAHGTTVATNALLERRGARTAFVATEGFADLLRIGRGERRDLYCLEPRDRECLVPAELSFEVRERVEPNGHVLVPLDAESVTAAARAVRESGAAAVAVCLLFSYLRDAHEREVGRVLSAIEPSPFVSLSIDVLPEFREYERASTVAVNAYVGPVMADYLRRLAASVGQRTLRVMGSHAGVLSVEQAARLPVATVLSGPAAGVIGAMAVAERCGRTDLITLDMGGTSTDVALCADGMPFTATTIVADLPVHRPAVDVHTVGAGGGSYAWVDDGGALRVGPQSAGATPGPAAYGKGGRRATVTDANVVLGRLPADLPLAGGLPLRPDAAREALAALAFEVGLDVERLALGVLDVVNATMERALRRVSVERGHSPADYTLVAFGGAGPLHACALADLLGIGQILVPAAPGALSALGLAVAAPAVETSRTVLRPAGAALTPAEIEAVFVELERAAAASLEGGAAVSVQRSADARYEGQSWELGVDWPGSASALREAFHQAHAARYGYERRAVPVELVTLRVRAVAETKAALPEPPPLERRAPGRGRLVLDDGRAVDVPVWWRWSLVPGEEMAGPAVIAQRDATTYLAPGWSATVGPWGDLQAGRVGSPPTG